MLLGLNSGYRIGKLHFSLYFNFVVFTYKLIAQKAKKPQQGRGYFKFVL